MVTMEVEIGPPLMVVMIVGAFTTVRTEGSRLVGL